MFRKGSLLIAVLAACAFAVSAYQAGASPGDEDAIRQNVKELEEGWNAKSGALFAKPFAEDADYVVINGMHIQGRKAITEGHQRIFDTIYKNTTLSLKVERVRFLRPDVALVHLAAHLEMNGSADKSDATITLVMTKTGGSWQIAAFQNTRVEAGRRA